MKLTDILKLEKWEYNHEVTALFSLCEALSIDPDTQYRIFKNKLQSKDVAECLQRDWLFDIEMDPDKKRTRPYDFFIFFWIPSFDPNKETLLEFYKRYRSWERNNLSYTLLDHSFKEPFLKFSYDQYSYKGTSFLVVNSREFLHHLTFFGPPPPIMLQEYLKVENIIHLKSHFNDRLNVKSGNGALKNVSDTKLLRDIEVIVDKGVTYAALILFGKRSALRKFLAQAEVIFEYRSSSITGPAQQRIEYTQGFFSFDNELWEKINLRNDLQHFQDGLFIWDIPTFNEKAIREAILNAVSHRDYREAGSIWIKQFPRKIIIASPGGIYTRKRGLDKETNKALLLKHIRSNAKMGSKFNELHQVLPSLSRDQIKQLLKELKAQGLIQLTGSTKASLWYPGI